MQQRPVQAPTTAIAPDRLGPWRQLVVYFGNQCGQMLLLSRVLPWYDVGDLLENLGIPSFLRYLSGQGSVSRLS